MLNENLKRILNEKGMTIQQLAELSDVSVETMKNIYYGRVKDPKISTVTAMAKALNCSIHYLLGDESILSQDEIELIKNYRNCGNHGKSIISLIGRYESKSAKLERESKMKHSIPCMIPLEKVQDGFMYTSCRVEDVETTVEEAYAAIELTSNAYAPIFYKGDRILIKDAFPENGEQAVFVREGRVYFREFCESSGSCLLKKVHGRSSDFETVKIDELECIGVYVGVIRA